MWGPGPLFVFLTVSSLTADNRTPATLAAELLPDPVGEDERALLRNDPGFRPRTGVSLQWEYHDLVHLRTSQAESDSLQTKAFVETWPGVPLADRTEVTLAGRRGAVVLKWRRHALVGGRMDQDDDYAVEGGVGAETALVSGLLGTERIRVLCELGLTVGTGSSIMRLDHAGPFTRAPSDFSGEVARRARLNYLAGVGVSRGRFDASAWGGSTTLAAGVVEVRNLVNEAEMGFPFFLAARELGGEAGLRVPDGRIGAGFSYLSLRGDTATDAVGGPALPSEVHAGGMEYTLRAMLDSLPIAPRISVVERRLGWGMRGYDGPTPYTWLDSNRASTTGLEVSLVPLLGIRAGVYEEFLRTGSTAPGRFDAFPFSSMVFFKPTMKKLDSLDISCRTLGVFAGREFRFRECHSLEADLSVSRVRAEGILATRELDTRLFFPRWRNPDTLHVLSEDFYLVIPRLNYRLDIGSLTASLGLRQLLPIETSTSGRGTSRSKRSSGTHRRVRGGTSCRFSLRYDLGREVYD